MYLRMQSRCVQRLKTLVRKPSARIHA